MPEQQGPVYFSGKLGNIVGYSRNGKHYYRSLPQHVEISNAAKLSSTDFGTASKAGKLIRTAIKPHLDIRSDGQHCNRLNKLLLKVLYAGGEPSGSRRFHALNLPGLTGHQFNALSRIGNIIKTEVVYDGQHHFHLNFPMHHFQNIKHAIKATHIEIKVIPVMVDFITNRHHISGTDQVFVDLMAPTSPAISFLYIQPLWAETIIIIQIKAFVNKKGVLKPSNNIKYQAAEIINVVPRHR